MGLSNLLVRYLGELQVKLKVTYSTTNITGVMIKIPVAIKYAWLQLRHA